MTNQVKRDEFVDNFTAMMNRYLKSGLPETGDNHEMLSHIHTLVLDKLLHISKAIEIMRGYNGTD